MIEPNYKKQYEGLPYDALQREQIDLVVKIQQKYPNTYKKQLTVNSKYIALKELMFEAKMKESSNL